MGKLMAGRSPCRHLLQAENAVRLDMAGKRMPAVVLLCGWADGAAPGQLLNIPIRLQRNALSGHLMRDGDCEKCAAYEAEK